MVVTISKRAPWNLGKQMLQIFPEPCEKCGIDIERNRFERLFKNFFYCNRFYQNSLGKPTPSGVG
ncbi:MAG: hypothetical protein AAF443_08075 [Chlamydiota bacterium]